MSCPARYYEPDLVIQENVPGFPHEVLAAILSPSTGRPLKHVFSHCNGPLGPVDDGSAEYSDGGAEPCYVCRTCTFAPTDLGAPTNRKRKYTSFALQPWLSYDVPCPSFSDLFFKAVVLHASAYLDAVPEEIRRAELEMMKLERGASPAAAIMASMGAGTVERLDDWMSLAKGMGLITEEGSAQEGLQMALVDTTQRAAFSKRVSTDCWPTLLTRTLLFDLVKQEFVPVASHWLAQGWPHPLAASIPAAIRAKFPTSSETVDGRHDKGRNTLGTYEQRALVGNSMHVCAVSLWVLCLDGHSSKTYRKHCITHRFQVISWFCSAL